MARRRAATPRMNNSRSAWGDSAPVSPARATTRFREIDIRFPEGSPFSSSRLPSCSSTSDAERVS